LSGWPAGFFGHAGGYFRNWVAAAGTFRLRLRNILSLFPEPEVFIEMREGEFFLNLEQEASDLS
jgi:hypothetical protein